MYSLTVRTVLPNTQNSFSFLQYALHVYDELMEKGKKYGIQHAGYYAPRALRIEKFFAFWGQDIDTTTTPFECGRVYRVNFEVSNSETIFYQRDFYIRYLNFY